MQAASANVGEIAAEFEALVHYAIQFISLSTLDYRAVWWRIFHAPTASEWCNVLVLAKLLFSLPASNGNLTLTLNKRTLLSNETLDDLLTLTSDQTPLNEFSADTAIDLWWNAKVRRPNQRKRQETFQWQCIYMH